MYELDTASVGTLAFTGASAAQAWVSAWTLFVAGLAVLAVARTMRNGFDGASAQSRAE